MYNLQNLEFTRVMPRDNGIFAYAKFPHWWSEYNFFIQADGTVKGKTTTGSWLELTNEMGAFIKTKVQSILKEEISRVYA